MKASLLSSLFLSSQMVYAAPPVVNTTIAVVKTGTPGFDGTTWDGSDINTAGMDMSPGNNVVRLNDMIQYRVEVSVNDSDVDDLTATVHAINGQIWTGIPTGCKTDLAEVTNQPVSSISSDGTELFCNLGSALEGTVRIFHPMTLVRGVDPETGTIILNDTMVSAEVSAGANGNPTMANATSIDTIVTANFRVDLEKALKVDATDPNTGNWIYRAPYKRGPNNKHGAIIEYVIRA